MANSQTPHSRKLRQDTAAAWIRGQVAKGGCRISLVLPPDAKARLDKLADRYGSKTAAVSAALDFAEQALALADRLQAMDGDKLVAPDKPDASR